MSVAQKYDEPEIPAGGSAPGRWVTCGDGVQKWEGPCRWSVRHGTALLHYETGEIVDATGVKTPDGSRCYLIRREVGRPGRWARAVGRGKWIVGTLRIEPDDVHFVDEAVQLGMGQDEATALDIDLMSCQAIRSLCADFAFCFDLYAALSATSWLRTTDAVKVTMSWRNAADLVAVLRGAGETSHDFFLSGNEGIIAPAVERAIRLHTNWRPSINGPAANATIQNNQALAILLNCEGRNAGSRPDWYTLAEPVQGDDPADRMHRAAASGRVELSEWDMFWQFVDLGDD